MAIEIIIGGVLGIISSFLLIIIKILNIRKKRHKKRHRYSESDESSS